MLLVAEALLRALESLFPINSVPTAYDKVGGIRNWPSFSGHYNKEGYSFYEINQHGWRDTEWQIDKPQGKKRIAVIGDSYVEALQVPKQSTFWSQLQTHLQKAGAGNVDVLAFGMSGFDVAQSYQVLSSEIVKYSPDIVVFAFLAANDVSDGVRALRDLPWKPYFYFNEHSHLELDSRYQSFVNAQNSGWRNSYREVRNRSHLLMRVDLLTKKIVLHWLALRLQYSFAQKSPAEACEPVKKSALTNDDLAWKMAAIPPAQGSIEQEAWKLSDALILKMRDCAKSINAEFIVLGVTTSDLANSEARRAGADPFFADRRMQLFTKTHGIPYVSLSNELLIAERHGMFMHGFDNNIGAGHWNAYGHEVAGKKLFEVIAKHLGLIGN